MYACVYTSILGGQGNIVFSNSLWIGQSGVQNPVGVSVLRTHPQYFRGSASLLHNEYQVSFLEIKKTRSGTNHPPPN